MLIVVRRGVGGIRCTQPVETSIDSACLRFVLTLCRYVSRVIQGCIKIRRRVSILIGQPVGEDAGTGNILSVRGLLQVIESKTSPGVVLS